MDQLIGGLGGGPWRWTLMVDSDRGLDDGLDGGLDCELD